MLKWKLPCLGHLNKTDQSDYTGSQDTNDEYQIKSFGAVNQNQVKSKPFWFKPSPVA